MAELSPPIAAKVESILQASAQILQDCLEQAREAGELAADEDCASLAGFIGFAWQGALARFKVGAGLAPLNAFMSRLELLLRALIPARTSHSPQESVHECPVKPCSNRSVSARLELPTRVVMAPMTRFPRAAYPTPRSSSTTAGAPPPASA